MRDQRQQEAIDSYIWKRGRKLIKAAPRFGKTFVAIKIGQEIKALKTCVLYPRKEIQKSWENEFKRLDISMDVTYSTFKSAGKLKDVFDIVYIDEPQEASDNELKTISEVFKHQENILGLSGTVTLKTYKNLNYHLNMETCYEYSISQAVLENVISNYTITIHKVKLDNKELVYKDSKGNMASEKKRFKSYEWVRNKMMDENKPYFFLDLKMISIIQNSIAKINKTKELLEKFKDDRCLVFCGLTEIADQLNIVSYHSKSKNKQEFENFCSGKGANHLACVKLIQSGITITPIRYGIMSYLSGAPEDSCQKICRMLGYEYGTPDKKAEIHIICTDEEFEEERLNTALSFFDEDKIKVLTN